MLEVDDAFAGGVCRCRHCGTIQTVPADAERVEAVGASAGEVRSASKPLYRREEQQDRMASGLDELADVVASSGLLSSGLQRQAGRGRRRTGTSQPEYAPLKPQLAKPDTRLMASVAAAVLVAVGVVLAGVYLLGGRPDAATPAPEADRSIAGLVLPSAVSFVMDAGPASRENFAAVADLLLDAVAAAPPGGRFQIVLWPAVRPDGSVGDVVSLPAAGLRDVNDGSIRFTRDRLNDVSGIGGTDPVPALREALRHAPEAVVLVTSNTAFMGPEFADAVLATWREAGGDVPVHTLSVGQTYAPRPMEAIADATGGRVLALTRPEIRDLRRRLANASSPPTP